MAPDLQHRLAISERDVRPRRNRARIAIFAAGVLIFLALWASYYRNRVNDRDSLVAGCQRATEQRRSDIAQDTDLSTVVAAERVNEVLARRAASTRRLVNCSEVYPPPSVWPWGG